MDADFASQVLWFDALIQNVDRTWRNPNLLVWHGDIWLIDHGSALYFQHNWPAARPLAPFDAKDHVLRGAATQVRPGRTRPWPRRSRPRCSTRCSAWCRPPGSATASPGTTPRTCWNARPGCWR